MEPPPGPNPRLSRVTVRQLKQLNDSTLIKEGTSQAIQRESDALKFVRQHTSLPVPEVRDTIIIDDGDPINYHASKILMQALPGLRLTLAWPSMSEAARRTTRAELAAYFAELRGLRQQPDDADFSNSRSSVEAPGAGWIGSCTHGPVYDHRVNNGWPCGPFDSVSSFHDFLVRPVARCPKPELVKRFRDQLSDDHSVVFTHADFAGDHVLVEPDTGHVTGIVDWEMAGWWPAYWEYNKSRHGWRTDPWWVELLHEIMPAYEKEWRVDMDLSDF